MTFSHNLTYINIIKRIIKKQYLQFQLKFFAYNFDLWRCSCNVTEAKRPKKEKQ